MSQFRSGKSTPVHFLLKNFSTDADMTTGTPAALVVRQTGATTANSVATNTVTYEASGIWTLVLTDAEMVGEVITVYCSLASARTVSVTMHTEIERDVSSFSVPKARTTKLTTQAGGLAGDKTLRMQIGEDKHFAIDFVNDLPYNTRLTSLDTVAIKTGTASGVTFSSPYEVDRTKAVVKIAGVSADTYVVNAIVTYDDGGTAEGDFTVVVTA